MSHPRVIPVGLSFIELPVSDWEAALTLYSDLFQATVQHLDSVRRWALLSLPGTTTGIAVYALARDAELQPPAPEQAIRLVVQVADLDAALAALRSRGFTHEPVRLHSDEHFRISGFCDPYGHVWRLWQPIPDAGHDNSP
ncbi:MAG: hypothetical protein K6T31_02190 [Alicyclobacillus sp.]|nr:hypothetical protein [Alicyclobacillus sp.]